MATRHSHTKNMNLLESTRLAIVGLTANKLRAFLTMLGIIIGVAAVITLISVGRGVEAVVIDEFQGLGNNLLFVFPGNIDPSDPGPARAGGAGLTLDDAEALADPFLVPDLLGVVPSYDRPAIVSYGRQETRTTISGTNTQFPIVRNFYPALGDFFSQQDLASGSRVAVIGQTVYEELFEPGEFPIGEDIRINNVNFRIIGMLEEKGGSGFNDQDDLILVPITTAQQRLFPARRADGRLRVDVIYAQVIDDVAGKTLASASTVDKGLRSEVSGKTKKEQATMVGKAIAERAKAAGISTVLFDRGGYLYHGRIKALADGAREGGLDF